MVSTFASIHRWFERSWIAQALCFGIVLISIGLMIVLGLMWYPYGIFLGAIPWMITSAVLNLGEEEDKRQRRVKFLKGLEEIEAHMNQSQNPPNDFEASAQKAHEEFMVHINAMNESAARQMENVRKLKELQDQLFPTKDEDPSAA